MADQQQSVSPLQVLLELPLHKLLKTEAEYEALYQNRLSRFQMMTITPGHVCDEATGAIKLTEMAHKVAMALLHHITTLATACMMTNRIEAAIAFNRTIALNSATDDAITGSTQKAYDFLRWAYDPQFPHRAERSFRQGMDEYLQGVSSFERQCIEMTVESLAIYLKTTGLILEAKRQLSELIAIYRGLLYSGIFGSIGSSLERKEFADKLLDLAIDVAGHPIPGLGLLIALAKLITTWDPNHLPSAITAANEVEEYFRTYKSVVEQWLVAGLTLDKALIP